MAPASAPPRPAAGQLVRLLAPALVALGASLAVAGGARLLGWWPDSPHATAVRVASFATFLFVAAVLQPAPPGVSGRSPARRLAFASGLAGVFSGLYYFVLRAAT